jgi:hypothetical protein
MASKRNMRKTRKIKRPKKIKKTKRHTRRRLISGGNYVRDFTSRTLDGQPTKAANKFVVTVPGYGTMSGSAYMRLKDDLDRNGNDFYD